MHPWQTDNACKQDGINNMRTKTIEKKKKLPQNLIIVFPLFRDYNDGVTQP